MEKQQNMAEEEEEPLLSPAPAPEQGGFRTMPFIIANGMLAKVASFGLTPNMTLYLMGQYRMEMAAASNVLFYWSAATNFLPVLGAILADSYVGRFHMIGFGSVVSLLGMILLWLTTVIRQARPEPCDESNTMCPSTTASQIILLFASFGLISIGSGGLGSSSLAFGADQLEKRNGRLNAGMLERYFTWYYASFTFSLLIALTCLVYIQDNLGFTFGFGVSAVLMFFSTLLFFLASPFYIKVRAKASLVSKVFQVLDFKALVKVMPIWSTGMLSFINVSQGSFSVIQASSMNRKMVGDFEVPAGSFGIFTVVSLVVWVALYDQALIPIASRVRGKPFHLTTRQRMGIGIFLSFLAMIATASVEFTRRSRANNPLITVQMSALWLLPQYCLLGMAEGFNAIAQNEFYMSELPESMTSVASTLCGVGMSVASLLASLLMSSIDDITGRDGQESWISSDIDKGHYDYYFWVLSGLSGVNMLYFLICCWTYGPCKSHAEKIVRDISDCV